MKKMMFMSILCMSLNINAMEPHKNTNAPNNQNLHQITLNNQSEEESDVDDNTLEFTATPSGEINLKEEESSEKSIEVPFEGDMSRESSQEPVTSSVGRIVRLVIPDDSNDSLNMDVSSKISHSNSNLPFSGVVKGSDGSQKMISLSDSNPYIPPNFKSDDSPASSGNESNSPSSPKSKKKFWPGYTENQAKTLGRRLSNALNSDPNSGDSSSNSSAIGSPGGFKNHQRYYDTNHKNIDSQKNSFNNAPVIKIGSNFGNSSKSSSNSSAIGSPGGFNKPWNHRHNSLKVSPNGSIGKRLNDALNSDPNNSSNSSSNSSATGSPRGLTKSRWNNKNYNKTRQSSDQDLKRKYGSLPPKNTNGSVPSSPQSSQQGFVGFSPKPISSSSSNGLPTPPPPPPVQANQNRTNPNVKEPVKSTVIIIEKKKKESSSSSSDDEK